MRFLAMLVGLFLLLVGVYFLGQNIIFTTQTAGYWWRDISGTGSALCVVAGTLLLLSRWRNVREMGWLLVGLGILLVFVSGGVILRPTSLWTLFLSFFAFWSGMQLITTGRIRI